MNDDSRAIVPVGQRGVVSSVARQIAIAEKLLTKIKLEGALSTTYSAKVEMVIQFAKSITAALISDDGKYILTISEGENDIHLWDVATEALLRVFGHSMPVSYLLAFQANNTIAVTEHSDGSTTFWDLATGRCRCQPSLSEFPKRILHPINKSSDRDCIYSPDCRYTLYKIQIDTDDDEEEDKEGDNFIDEQDNAYLLSGSDFVGDHLVVIGDDADNPVAISNGGHYALLENDLSFSLWDVEQGSILGNFENDSRLMDYQHVACSIDENHLVAAGSGRYLHHWDLQKGQLVNCVQCAGHVNAIVFSKENHLAISQTDIQPSLFTWHEMHLQSVWPDFQGDVPFQLYDIHTGKSLKILEGHDDIIGTIDFSSDAKWIMASGYERVFSSWHIETGSFYQTKKLQRPEMNFLASSSAGLLIGRGNTCWFRPKWTCDSSKVQHPDIVTSITLSPDDKHFATGCTDNIIRIWTVDGDLSNTLQAHIAPITSVMFSPIGDHIISASEDRTIKLWTIKYGVCLRTFTGHNASIINASFIKNGQQIVSASQDGTIRFWDTHTGKELARCYGFDDGNWIVVAPDGRYDSSNYGECPQLRWTVGMESFPAAKFKDRYYTPGLLVQVRA